MSSPLEIYRPCHYLIRYRPHLREHFSLHVLRTRTVISRHNSLLNVERFIRPAFVCTSLFSTVRQTSCFTRFNIVLTFRAKVNCAELCSVTASGAVRWARRNLSRLFCVGISVVSALSARLKLLTKRFPGHRSQGAGDMTNTVTPEQFRGELGPVVWYDLFRYPHAGHDGSELLDRFFGSRARHIESLGPSIMHIHHYHVHFVFDWPRIVYVYTLRGECWELPSVKGCPERFSGRLLATLAVTLAVFCALCDFFVHIFPPKVWPGQVSLM